MDFLIADTAVFGKRQREREPELNRELNVAAAIVGAAVIGGVASSQASKNAADAQSGAAENATALQKYIFDQQTAMQKPWLDAGNAGLNKLSFMMGLSPTGYGSGSTSMPTMETPEAIRARLLQQYTTTSNAMVPGGASNSPGDTPTGSMVPTSTVNEAGLAKAIAEIQAKQKAAYDRAMSKATAAAGRDPNYGSLLDTFGMDDFEADPGYAFRQSQGEQALQRQLAAGGKLYSGEAMKDMAKFSQGLASQEFGAAFDRFNVGKTNQFNRLASISGIGQTAANQTGAAGMNYANQAGNNIMGAGNAQAAGMVGSANAWTNAMGQGISQYNQNQLFNSMQPRSSYQGYNTSYGGGGGFGTGSSYGNEDYGQYF